MNNKISLGKNTKERLELAGTIGLVIILGVVMFSGIRARKAKNQGNKPASVASALSPAAPVSENLYARLDQEGKLLKLSRDPFTGVAIIQDLGEKTRPVLNGIIWDRSSALAILNGNIVRQGDRVGRFTVLKIRENSVIVSDGEEAFELRLVH